MIAERFATGTGKTCELAFLYAHALRVERILRPEEVDFLRIELCEIGERVQGNRSDTWPIGWADLRLYLRSTLERCIEILDAEEPPQL